MHTLVISDDEGKTVVFPLVNDEVTVGRKEGNTIRLTERNVSRSHAKVTRSGDSIFIEDLQSYNGISVNGERIDSKVEVKSGDRVVIGDYLISLQEEEAASTGAAAKKADGPPARLVMLTPPAPSTEFALPERALNIGRAEDLDIWVNHRSISREHAEVRREGEVLHVKDLGSANGMRLNGKEVDKGTIMPGDELELGQVRFRYVGEGQRYSLESDRTVQMNAVLFEEPMETSRSKNVWVFAALALAAVIAIIIVMSSGGEEEPPAPVEPMEVANTGESLMEAVEACLESKQEGDYAAAVEAGERAIAIDGDSRAAETCLTESREMLSAQVAFDEGRRFLEAGDVEDAWMTFDALPANSVYRVRDEVELARVEFAELFLNRAEQEASTNPEEAGRSLQQVFAVIDHSDEPLMSRAERLETALQSPVSGMAVTIMRPPRRTSNVGMGMGMGMATMMSVIATTEMTQMTAAVEPQRQFDPIAIQRECSYRSACIVARLEEGPKNQLTLPHLIEAYRALGNDAASQRYMRQYVRRYPSTRRATDYRRVLESN